MDPMRRGFPFVPRVRLVSRLVLALSLALGAAACDRKTEPTPVPIPIAPASVVESYTGTLFMAGSNLHTFAVAQNGEMKVTLTAISTVPVDADPNADPPVAAIPSTPVTTPMTLTVGQPTLTTLGVQCSSLKSVVAPAGAAPQLTGQALLGTFCVSISDPNGELPRASNYAITVIHS
jgi:hypothetical protein